MLTAKDATGIVNEGQVPLPPTSQESELASISPDDLC